jgi:hypothetical protein
MTPKALLGNFASGVDVSHSVGAGCHAIPAADTTMGIDVDNAICPLDTCVDRANRDTNGIFTVVADDGKGKLLSVRIVPFFHFLNPTSPYTQRHVILALASDCTGVAADALPQIEQHGQANFIFFHATLILLL